VKIERGKKVTKKENSILKPESISNLLSVPLTRQVEDLASNQNVPEKSPKKVTIQVPGNKIARKWTRRLEKKKQVQEEGEDFRRQVLTGKVPSAIVDSGATSSCGKNPEDFEQTSEVSNKTFEMPTGGKTRGTNVAKLRHDLREPARRVDMVPALQRDSLLSCSKFADANYIWVFTPGEVKVYDGDTVKFTVSEEAVLSGFRDP